MQMDINIVDTRTILISKNKYLRDKINKNNCYS